VSGISLHAPSSSTMQTVQKLPTFKSKLDQSTSDMQSSINQVVPRTLPFNPATNSPMQERGLHLTTKSPDEFGFGWNLDEINRFTQEIFKRSTNNTSY